MAEKIRVLLVDDEKHVRQLIKAVLIPLNCEVVGEAENGQQAVTLYQEKRPDSVLLDINMPVMDGQDALRAIMALDSSAVVIMLTSLSDIGSIQTCLDAGASHYIRKDTPPGEMREIIRETWQHSFSEKFQ